MKNIHSALMGFVLMLTLAVGAFAAATEAGCCPDSSCCHGQACCKNHKK